MLSLRPKPVDLQHCNPRECSRWARLARALCGASKRCPVILAVEALCPPCLIGDKARWQAWRWGAPLGIRERFRGINGGEYWQPSTLRALVGPLWLAWSAQIPLPIGTPLPIILDWLEEAEWIDCTERHRVEDLAGLLPFDVPYQRAQLGHLSPTWPWHAPRPFAIQHALTLFLG